MNNYLYGASVQGIQQFIFRTNKLQNIVKASEQVNDICTTKFQGYYSAKDDKLVVSAAGNIKCIFSSEERCREAVLAFPKEVMNYAPGITISQAVVKMTGAYADFATAVEELERKLRAQRNKPTKSVTLGLMGIERSRQTGLPMKDGEERGNNEGSEPTMALYNTLFCKSGKGADRILYKDAGLDTDDMASENSWIAIIHADGNGLGEIVSRIGTDQEQLHTFSKELDNATISAAQQACKEVIGDDAKAIRPVVLGGDDLTMFCRADKAIAFVKAYLDRFEEETKKMSYFNGMGKLTACAGIAFIKSSYPFYYGYNLAETLCGEAKKDAKSEEIKGAGKEVPSCLMFHKVQSSFVESYAEIERKELTPNPNKEHSFRFGPYYLHAQGDKRWTIKDLISTAEDLSKEDNNAAKTDIRQWMTLMKDYDAAQQLKERVNQIATKDCKDLFNQATEPAKNRNDGKSHYPAYDILTLVTIKNQKTKDTNTTQI